MTKLALDPMCVLSAWEEIGGSAFSSDDVLLDDPDAFNLDLSSWEARLKPLSAASTSQEANTNLFASLFNPASMCFAFLPGCAAVPTATGNAGFFSAAAEAPQVVPLCPTLSAGSIDNNNSNAGAWGTAAAATAVGTDCCTAMDDAPQGSHMDEDFNMSIHFSDVEPLPSSASPTCSSEAGIVPDFDIGGSPRKGGSSTATSGSMPCAPAAAGCHASAATAAGMLQLPVLPSHLCTTSVAANAASPALPSSMFVPVSSQPHAGQAPASCGGGAPVVKQEPESQAEPLQQPQLPVQPPQPPQPPQTLGKPAAAAAAARQSSAPAQQQQQSGAAVHVRTRAECLERYRQKKARRLYTKKIRYQLRKINADKRPRIKGRFVKKEELAEFLATQRGGAAAREEVEDPYFGMDSDDE
ncbi:hypothetical protein PLESTF_001315900 [Pleodorina starrii]|nr:hypothetical protein PLESTM_000496400 [Pleodorina starrii]GLC72977.1 hypothetical protein PLESTF_001315900 [Pleodorina starrii]